VTEQADLIVQIMGKIGDIAKDIAPIFTNLVLSLLVAVCVAFAVFGYAHFKDARVVQSKFLSASLIIVSLFFVAAIFWFFIVKLSLKGA